MGRYFTPLVAIWMLVCCWGVTVAEAAEGQDTRTAFYGMFKQAPEGGIIFTNPQEPDVVYLPFDPRGVMDNLNIWVAVRGSIKDTFTRQGKTVHVLVVDAIKPMTAEYGPTTVAKDTVVGLPGCDAAEVHTYPDHTCALYDRYAILTRPAPYASGQDIRVRARKAGDLPAALCENLEGKPLFEIPDGGDYVFAGLAGDTLLVRNGPADAIHGLMGVDLSGPRQTLDVTVAPGERVDHAILHYLERAAHAGGKACPAGKTAVRPMRFDLRSGKARPDGTMRCWP